MLTGILAGSSSHAGIVIRTSEKHAPCMSITNGILFDSTKCVHVHFIYTSSQTQVGWRYFCDTMIVLWEQDYHNSIKYAWHADLEWNPWYHLRLLKIVQLLDQRCQGSKCLPMFCSWWVFRCLFICVPSAAQFLQDISWQLSSSGLPYFYWWYIFEGLHWQLPSWWNNGTLTNDPTTTSIQAFIFCIKGWTLPVMKPVNNVRHLLHQKWSVCMYGVSS